MTPEVRTLAADELPAFVESLTSSFLERPDVDRAGAELAKLWELDRVRGAFDDEKRLVGTFRSWGTELTVPGGARLPAAGVSAVSVLPSHRRRGILRAMTAADHAASRERGEVAALLYSAEYPIYGRFGYGVGTTEATWTLDKRGTGLIGGASGRVELVKPSEETARLIAPVYDAWRSAQVGEIKRLEYRWRYDLGLVESAWGDRWKGFLALHRDGSGAVDGYVRYAAEEKWEQRQPRATVTVNELHALTDDAYAALWRFLAEIDWAATVKAEQRRPGERLPWLLTNARAASVSDVGDGLWVRLFDLPRALGARAYEREARVVLEVIDSEAVDGRLRIQLDAGGGGATCRVTDAAPDLTLDVAALGAAYLGGTRLADAILARGVDEHRAGALREADALFRTVDEPWCSTHF